AYPDLKANTNFLALQEELTGTEGRIAYARQFYNESTLSYDNALESFPSNLVGGAFNFEPKPYFEAETTEREAVKVDFGQGGGTQPPSTPASPPAVP
nr:LemA family protein [Actinomycetota bacterium]